MNDHKLTTSPRALLTKRYSGPRASGVEEDELYPLGCVCNQNDRVLCKHEQTLDVGGGRACRLWRLSSCLEYREGGARAPP
eukprot:CAMPEP_0179454536 /NCGR_PEP_ID=MMETSP0799-20121207/38387_1 /TAXON_ID=46947 /ORGANISM="Geminigera cryophila, Strain CCMP2564" /LENGTH=80 /DNA_ID=CAMNT_0021252487 /DNA_START=532 /DNA_END=771 /DNA_ORIENTATION=+